MRKVASHSSLSPLDCSHLATAVISTVEWVHLQGWCCGGRQWGRWHLPHVIPMELQSSCKCSHFKSELGITAGLVLRRPEVGEVASHSCYLTGTAVISKAGWIHCRAGAAEAGGGGGGSGAWWVRASWGSTP